MHMSKTSFGILIAIVINILLLFATCPKQVTYLVTVSDVWEEFHEGSLRHYTKFCLLHNPSTCTTVWDYRDFNYKVGESRYYEGDEYTFNFAKQKIFKGLISVIGVLFIVFIFSLIA